MLRRSAIRSVIPRRRKYFWLSASSRPQYVDGDPELAVARGGEQRRVPRTIDVDRSRTAECGRDPCVCEPADDSARGFGRRFAERRRAGDAVFTAPPRALRTAFGRTRVVKERVGHGFDAHRLAAGRRFVLGGVDRSRSSAGPLGHSDGDALAHAVADAVLGACALGDLGKHFPSEDPQWKGARLRFRPSLGCRS